MTVSCSVSVSYGGFFTEYNFRKLNLVFFSVDFVIASGVLALFWCRCTFTFFIGVFYPFWMLSSLLFVSCASEGLRDFSPGNLRLAITRLYVLPCSGRRYSRLLVLVHLRVLCNCFLNPAIQGKIKAETQIQKLASCLFLRVVAVPCGTESLVKKCALP